MARLPRVAMVLSIVVTADIAVATEQPIGASKLFLRRTTSGKEKLAFVSKDPGFLFPTIGGPDDPSPSGSAGLVVELFSSSTPSGVALDAPGGVGVPGWTVRTSTPPRVQYKNPVAPASPSTFRTITLRAGKLLKLSGKATGLDPSAPLGTVGIRITTGTLINCALFGPATVRKDGGGTFTARNAVAEALADCSDASLVGLVPCGQTLFPQCDGQCPAGSVCASQDLATCSCVSSDSPCGDTSPVCNGTCPAGEQCFTQGTAPFVSCTCAPVGSTPCGSSAYPICGGECPAGETCNPFTYSSPFLTDGCSCTAQLPCGSGGGECAPGFQCAVAPGFTVCAPIPCGGNPAYPTCDGSCPAGWGCHALQLSDAAFATCLCAPPGSCDAACGGYDCGPGGVCVTDVSLSSCACQ